MDTVRYMHACWRVLWVPIRLRVSIYGTRLLPCVMSFHARRQPERESQALRARLGSLVAEIMAAGREQAVEERLGPAGRGSRPRSARVAGSA